MGFWSSLGNRVSSGIHSLGKKVGRVVKRGVKFVGEHAKSIEEGANVVSHVAGALATGAAMVGLEPVAGVLGGVAAGAKGVSKLAGLADSAYQTGAAASRAVDAVRHGHLGKAVLAGSRAHLTGSGAAGAAKGAGKKAFKEIQRARNKQVAY
tara:strand:- start:96 stop:551 length:456 start_codon:yes stop_codon:yes gene_type:complete